MNIKRAFAASAIIFAVSTTAAFAVEKDLMSAQPAMAAAVRQQVVKMEACYEVWKRKERIDNCLEQIDLHIAAIKAKRDALKTPVFASCFQATANMYVEAIDYELRGVIEWKAWVADLRNPPVISLEVIEAEKRRDLYHTMPNSWSLTRQRSE